MTNSLQELIKDLVTLKTADALDLTIAQVKTLNTLEAEHDRAYDWECREARLGSCMTPKVETFKVEIDKPRGLPRVTFYNVDQGWMDEAVVLKDGSLDFQI
jgi:hypothetical protein